MSVNTPWLSKMRFLFVLLCGLFVSSCRNLYRDFSDKTSDEYLIAQTRYLIDDYDFDGAISTISPVLTRQPTNQNVVYLASAAYAGKGGLRILDLFSTIGSEIDSKSLLEIFGEHFAGADDDDVEAVEEAFSIINTYEPDPTKRSARLNFYATFLLFSRIGVLSARYALKVDGTLDPDFDNCQESLSAVGDTGIPSVAIDSIIDAFVKLPTTLGNSGSSGFASVSAKLPNITAPATACGDTGGAGQASCLAVRTLLGTGLVDSGIGFNVNPRPGNVSGTANDCPAVTL